MSATTEAPFVVSHNYCAIRANTVEELESKLQEFIARPNVSDLIARFRQAVSSQGVSVPVTPTVAQAVEAVVDAGIVAETVSAGGIEVKDDQWGNKFTRGNPDAGSCVHGARIVKNGTNKSGKAYKAYVCVNDSPFRDGKYDKNSICDIAWPPKR